LLRICHIFGERKEPQQDASTVKSSSPRNHRVKNYCEKTNFANPPVYTDIEN
jgi:hypothetical protein